MRTLILFLVVLGLLALVSAKYATRHEQQQRQTDEERYEQITHFLDMNANSQNTLVKDSVTAILASADWVALNATYGPYQLPAAKK